MYQYPQNKSFTFDYQGKTHTVTLGLEAQTDEKYEMAPHTYSYQGNLPKNWREDYYAMYINHKDDQQAIQDLLGELRRLLPRGSQDEVAEIAIAFVQGAISYDWDTFHNIDQGRIRYPYETLWDGTGVCADKSMLLARLLIALGYGVVFFTYERANHMAIGLQAPAGFGSYRTPYAFVESTSPTPVGRIPETYVGGTKLERNPLVVPAKGAGSVTFNKITSNQKEEQALERQYGKEHLMMAPGQQAVHKEMVMLEAELKALKKEMRGCRGNLPPDKFAACQQLQAQHNSKVQAYNSLVARFNSFSA